MKQGTGDNPGINQRALLELFRITEERRDDWEYSVVVSVLEIYNEMVRDLLSLQHTEKLEIKQGPEGNHVPGVTQVQVTCLQELNEVCVCVCVCVCVESMCVCVCVCVKAVKLVHVHVS